MTKTPVVLARFTYNPAEEHRMTMRDISDALANIVALHMSDKSAVSVLATPADTLSRNLPDVFIEIENLSSQVIRLPSVEEIQKEIRATVHELRDWATEGPAPSFSMMILDRSVSVRTPVIA